MLVAADLTVPYGLRPGLDLRIQAGERVGFVGPNGAGKSTLLRAFAGRLKSTGGTLTLDGRAISELPARELARQVAVVPQSAAFDHDFTVLEVVAMGRHPHRARFAGFTETDRRATDEAVRRLDLDGLRERSVRQLSGGEQQRVLAARALAQTPRWLLLDEPTAHLDLAYTAALLEVLAALEDTAVLCVLHDLNLAALHFPRLVLLDQGAIVADGPPAEVLTEARLASVYGARVHVVEHPTANAPQVLPATTSRSSP